MTARRFKTPASPRVPQSEAEAQAMLAELAELCRTAEEITNKADADVAKIVEAAEAKKRERIAKAEETIAPLGDEIHALVRALQTFVEAYPQTIPKGRRSVAWPEGTVGFRRTPLKAVVAKGKTDDVVAALEACGLEACVNIIKKLKKAELVAKAEEAKGIEGLTFSQRDEFFVKPAGTEQEYTETVEARPVTRSGKGA